MSVLSWAKTLRSIQGVQNHNVGDMLLYMHLNHSDNCVGLLRYDYTALQLYKEEN
jgi:hypothetical protein